MQPGADVFFLLMGAILVFAMHGGFAFLETGTVRHKNQVNALVKILVDFAISTVFYFMIGYTIAYGVDFFANAKTIAGGAPPYDAQGYTLVRFFFLCTFAAAVPAIISGGIAERAKFGPQAAATAILVGFCYPLIEGVVLERQLRGAGLPDGTVRRGLQGFRRLDRRACLRRLGGARRRADARAAPRPLRRRPRRRDAALLDPVAGARLVAAVHRLVRL